MDTTKKLAEALRAVIEGSEYKSIGGDEPMWHRIAMPTRANLDIARLALAEYDALSTPAAADAPEPVRTAREALDSLHRVVIDEPGVLIEKHRMLRLISQAETLFGAPPAPQAPAEPVALTDWPQVPKGVIAAIQAYGDARADFEAGAKVDSATPFGTAILKIRAALAASQPAPVDDLIPEAAAARKHAGACRSHAARLYNETPSVSDAVEAGSRLQYAAQLLDILAGGINAMKAAEIESRAAPVEAQAVPEIDYKALIADCFRTTGFRQGEKGCIGFARGAEWFRAKVLAAAPTPSKGEA